MTERSPQLLAVEADAKRRGSRELVVLDPDACANCGCPMVIDTSAQPALFRHGGYGETRRGTARWCPECGWSGGHSDEAENPRERAHKTPAPSDAGSRT